HFEKYLELRPKANNADLIRQNTEYCKVALAKEVPFTLNSDQVRKEVERLARENNELRQQLEQVKAQLPLRAAPATNAATAFNPLNAPNLKPFVSAQVSANPAGEQRPAGERQASAPPPDPARATAAQKTHLIQSGDTPYSIARNYGVKLASLLSANPGLDPRRLRPGQTLVIPLP